MLNIEPYHIYRNCIDNTKGNCPFLYFNQYNVECCSIDNIVQGKYYGCTPQSVIDKKNKQE